jgi:hypothetical protein
MPEFTLTFPSRTRLPPMFWPITGSSCDAYQILARPVKAGVGRGASGEAAQRWRDRQADLLGGGNRSAERSSTMGVPIEKCGAQKNLGLITRGSSGIDAA